MTIHREPVGFTIPTSEEIPGTTIVRKWSDLQRGLWIRVGLGVTWYSFYVRDLGETRAWLEPVAPRPAPGKEWDFTGLAERADYLIAAEIPLRILRAKHRGIIVERIELWYRLPNRSHA